MKNTWIVWTLFVCPSLLAGGSPLQEQGEQRTISSIVEEVKDSTVSIVTTDASGSVKSIGSGFIVDGSGLIATNHHVIEGASNAFVKLPNGSIGLVEGFVAVNPDADLVLIKVGVRDLNPVTLGDLTRARVGDGVVAIGNPQGFEASVSNGIISAIREFRDGTDVIQTTAPISQGSSGGALFDMTGKVVGVTSLYHSGGQNLNFAYSVKHLHELLDEIGDVRPLTDLPQIEVQAEAKPRRDLPESGIWMNTEDGAEWEVRFEEDYVSANYLFPAPLRPFKDYGAHYFCEARPDEDRQWQGRCILNWPVQCQQGWVLCRNEMPLRSAQVTSTRFEGAVLGGNPASLSCGSCSFDETYVERFTLIPAFEASRGAGNRATDRAYSGSAPSRPVETHPYAGLVGTYGGNWISSRYHASGGVTLLMSVDNQGRIFGRVVLSGSPIRYTGDDLVVEQIRQIGPQSWEVSMKGANSALKATGLFQNGTFMGEYSYRRVRAMVFDSGRWVLER